MADKKPTSGRKDDQKMKSYLVMQFLIKNTDETHQEMHKVYIFRKYREYISLYFSRSATKSRDLQVLPE